MEPTVPHTPAAETATGPPPREKPTERGPLPVVPGYEVIELVGRGGMGRVYRARHLGLGRTVALKLLSGEADDTLLARFREEARAVARLQHPNIAQLYETGTADGRPYLAQEFLDGGALAQKLAGRPQPPAEAAALVETVARAVQHSHDHGILHRDLKPGNILLAADGTPKVADFGLAKPLAGKAVDTWPESGGALTRTGEVLGTPGYMPPEQASGVVSKLGPGADVYALGAILYEMLTGRPPFQAPDVLQTLMMVLTLEPVSPRTLQPKVPKDLETICLKCLEKPIEKRYVSAAALAEDLRRFRSGEPIVARPVGPVGRAVKWARRRKAAAALVGVSAVLLVVLVAAAVVLAVGYARLRTALDGTKTANEKLSVAATEAQDSLALAHEAIDRMLVRLSDDLAPVPQAEAVRRASLEDARRLYQRLTKVRPDDEGGRSRVAQGLVKLARVYRQLGRLDDAEAAYREARAVCLALAAEFPAETSYRRELAGVMMSLASLDLDRGRTDSCEQGLTAARAELDALPAAVQDESAVLDKYGFLCDRLGLLYSRAKRPKDAEASHREALAIRLRLADREPGSVEIRSNVVASRSNLGTVLLVLGRPAEAAPEFEAAAKLLEGLTGPRFQLLRGQVTGNAAVALEQSRRPGDAEKVHKAAIDQFAALVADFPGVPEYRFAAARARLNLARMFWPQGRLAEALTFARAALPDMEYLAAQFPKNPAYAADLALCRKVIEFLLDDLKQKPPGKPL
ncbi:MAG: serine/threonine protein kinase [Gemmataceae bacterium]|nr:serine/threonine protein kinase [Gemmataceae bacterium]